MTVRRVTSAKGWGEVHNMHTWTQSTKFLKYVKHKYILQPLEAPLYAFVSAGGVGCRRYTGTAHWV